MTLELIDFVVETDGVDLEDFPPEVQARIDDELAELTGGDGGPGSSPDDPPQSIIVDAGGDGDYKSIQTAINEGAESGDVIFVEPGEYESFTVDVEDLTLKAAGDASPTIDAGDTRNNIQADNITVDGLSVVFENQGIYVESQADNVTIQNSEFSLPADVESTGYAIRYEGSTSDGEVRNNEFVGITNTQSQEFGNGVIISGPDGHEVVKNTFDSNSIGVNVGSQQPAGELLVSDNTFTSQDDFAVALNHDDSESPSITISSNDFDSNSTGVLTLSGGDIDISNNEFDAVGEEGETYVFDPNDAVDLDTIETENSFPGPAPVTGKVAINPNQPTAYNFNDDDGGTITRGGAAVEKTDGTLVVLPEGQDSKLNQFDSDATLLYVSNNAGIVNANAQAAPERENPAVYGYNLDGKGDALPAGEFEGTTGSDAPLPETGTNYQIEDYDILQGQLVIYWVTQEGELVDPE